MLTKIVTVIGLVLVLSQGAMATDNHTEWDRKCDELSTQVDRDACKKSNPWNAPSNEHRGSGRVDADGNPIVESRKGEVKYQDPAPTPPRTEPPCIKTGTYIVSPYHQ